MPNRRGRPYTDPDKRAESEKPQGRSKKPLTWDELPDVMTVDEYASFARVDRNTIYHAIASNEIPHFKFGRVIRIAKQKIAPMHGYGPQREKVVS